eukprot:SAG22_NODE_546_length_9261_cov_18.423925_9_plen_178_part_00
MWPSRAQLNCEDKTKHTGNAGLQQNAAYRCTARIFLRSRVGFHPDVATRRTRRLCMGRAARRQSLLEHCLRLLSSADLDRHRRDTNEETAAADDSGTSHNRKANTATQTAASRFSLVLIGAICSMGVVSVIVYGAEAWPAGLLRREVMQLAMLEKYCGMDGDGSILMDAPAYVNTSH